MILVMNFTSYYETLCLRVGVHGELVEPWLKNDDWIARCARDP